MIESNLKPLARQPGSFKLIITGVVLIILVGISTYAYNAFRALQGGSLPAGMMSISENALENEYGLRVNLVAVTAAGGLVDLRLKVLDAEKANQLLQEGKNLPQLAVTGNGLVLDASNDSLPQSFKLENDGNLYLMYPNARNSVKPGTSLNLIFGDLQVGPIQAK